MIEAKNLNKDEKEDWLKGVEVLFNSNLDIDKERVIKDFGITEKEFPVLCIMLFYETSKDISHILKLNDGTVRSYKSRIISKLGVSTRGAIINLLLEYIKLST